MTTRYPSIDEFDRKILEIVQTNNMMSHREITETVSLSVPAIARRLRRLRTEGIITSDVSVIRPEFVGVPLTLIVNVAVESAELKQIDVMRRRFLACPQVQQCYDVTGDIDFILVMLVRDMLEFETLTRSLFHESGNVRRFHTFVAMQRVKASLQVPIAHD